MSAVHSPATLQQLALTLQPHRVLIHHDFTQQPEFVVTAPNASFVSKPFRTGWDDWGFCQGIFRLLEQAMVDPQVEYFQLLSPTCLPIRPLDEFAAMLATDAHDAHNEFFDLHADEDALLNFAYRAFAPARSLRSRVLWRCAEMWARDPWHTEDRCNLQIRVVDSNEVAVPGRIGRWVARRAREGWFGSHPFTPAFRALVGGAWFGANRKAAQVMLERYADLTLQAWFSKAHLADEMLISTILGNSSLRVGPSNHFVNTFDKERPRWITAADLPNVLATGRYFGRKFADDPADPARLAMFKAIGWADHAPQ